MPTPASRPAAVLCFCCCSILGLLLPASLTFPLCTDQRAPLPLNGTLPFCGNAGTSSCCDAAAGAALRKQLDAAKVSDAPCAAVLKSLLCAEVLCRAAPQASVDRELRRECGRGLKPMDIMHL